MWVCRESSFCVHVVPTKTMSSIEWKFIVPSDSGLFHILSFALVTHIQKNLEGFCKFSSFVWQPNAQKVILIIIIHNKGMLKRAFMIEDSYQVPSSLYNTLYYNHIRYHSCKGCTTTLSCLYQLTVHPMSWAEFEFVNG